jgi:DNA-binding GntR family transcriptional regulator
MKVDNNDPRPPYAQLADNLRAAIQEGRLAPGERLPAGRDLALQSGVALMTVRKAIDVLRSEGLVSSVHGRGVFVRADEPEGAFDELAALRASVEDLAERVAELEQRDNVGRAK